MLEILSSKSLDTCPHGKHISETYQNKEREARLDEGASENVSLTSNNFRQRVCELMRGCELHEFARP